MAGNQFELAEAFTTLSVDDAKMKLQLQGAKKQVVDLEQTMMAAGKTAAIFLAGGVAGIGLLVREAAEAEEVMSKFDAVFKSSADEVRAWAEALAEATGRSRFAIMQFAAQLQDTFVPLGFARDRAAELSKELTELAIDLSSFNNIDSAEALNLLNSALVGNHEAVRRFGITITEATLKEELMAIGADNLTGKALALAKVQARLNIIMSATTDAQGDAIKTADSTANQIVRLQSSFKDMRVEMGQLFIPTARDVIAHLMQIINLIRGMTPEMKENAAAAVVLALKIAGLVVALVSAAKAIDMVRKASILLQAVWSKNPVMLAVTALALLAVTIWTLVEAEEASKKATDAANRAQEDAIRLANQRADAQDRLNKKVGDSVDVNNGMIDSLEKATEALRKQNKAASDRLLTAEQKQERDRDESREKTAKFLEDSQKRLNKLKEEQEGRAGLLALREQNKAAAEESKEKALREAEEARGRIADADRAAIPLPVKESDFFQTKGQREEADRLRKRADQAAADEAARMRKRAVDEERHAMEGARFADQRARDIQQSIDDEARLTAVRNAGIEAIEKAQKAARDALAMSDELAMKKKADEDAKRAKKEAEKRAKIREDEAAKARELQVRGFEKEFDKAKPGQQLEREMKEQRRAPVRAVAISNLQDQLQAREDERFEKQMKVQVGQLKALENIDKGICDIQNLQMGLA